LNSFQTGYMICCWSCAANSNTN